MSDSSASEDDSGSGSSGSEESGSSSSSDGRQAVKPSRRPGASNTNKSKANGKVDWRKDPELYGIRRSGRARKETGSGSSEDSSPKKKKKRRESDYSTEEEESEESDWSEDEDTVKKPVKRKPPQKKPVNKNKRRKDSSDESDDYQYERTARTRGVKAAKGSKPSYVVPDTDEDVDEDTVQSWTIETEETPDDSVTVEKVIDIRLGTPGATGPGTTVYSIKQRGDPNKKNGNEKQFLIKWKGYSHLHNTWESEESLKVLNAKGMKKVDNFHKKQEEIEDWKAVSTPEDIEYMECQLQMQQELQASYTVVERIVDMQGPVGDEEYPDYYVKWKNLPYAEATWENGRLIEEQNQEAIMKYKEREESRFTPSKSCKVLKYRPKFHEEKSQPEFLGDSNMRLRDYQLQGLNWMIHSWCRHNSVILADEMGLGKTIQSISFLYYLFHKYQLYGPFLVIVPLSTLDAWQNEFAKWAPDMNVLTYIGDVTSRTIIRSREWIHPGNKRTKFNALLTTYEILLKDKAELSSLSWACMMIDEAHRLKNKDSLLYQTLEKFDADHKLLVTGTPLQNSLIELWSLLHFIMPLKFDDWEAFNDEYGSSRAEKRGYKNLHKVLEPFILRRVKKDVEKDLPAKVEQILRVDMSKLQKQYYKYILTRNYGALMKGTKGSTISLANIVVELKKCCNHAYLTKPPDDKEAGTTKEERLEKLLRGSGKLLLLDKLLVRLQETGHRVLIFSQMVRMLDVLSEYLEIRRFPFQRLDGGIKGELRKNAIEHFNAEGSQDFCFLLSTRAGGLGINLATADTVIIFDSDWNPQNDLQAQARAHRIGQKGQVNVYRFVTSKSVEEDIIERAKKKMVLDHLVIQRMDTTGRTILKPGAGNQDKSGQPFSKDELNAILKFGAEELFKEEEDKDTGDEPVCDIDEILKRAETRTHEEGDDGDDLMSGFKVASLAVDEDDAVKSAKMEGGIQKLWDEIIPSNVREELEEEERQKELAELYLGPRQRKTVLGGENKENENKRKRGNQTDESGQDSDGEEKSDPETPPKKRKKDEKIKGFNDADIRRFIKAYKKFPLPLTRMSDIALDADLTEKPVANLVDLGRLLRERCTEALDHETDPTKKVESVKIGKVSVNPKTLIETEALLRPLGKLMPHEASERRNWVLDLSLKDAHFDVAWGVEEDSKLLVGIWEHGLGSWEQIKADKVLDLSGKILLNASCKPQSKHLDVRAGYLLRMLQRKAQQGKIVKKKKVKKPMKVKDSNDDLNKEYKSKEIIEDDDTSDEESKKKEKKEKKKDEKKKEKPKAALGPVHIGSNELLVKSELDPATFAQCKEKMRDVKKSLKALDKPDPNQTPDEQVSNTRRCLVKIGRHIDSILEPMSEDKARDWRSHLWYFVSNFTEFDAKKLFKLYRHAMKKAPEEGEAKESSQEKEEKKEKSKDREKHHKKKHVHKEKDRMKDREGRKSQDSDSHRVAPDPPVERKERIAPPRSPDMDRDNNYRASMELAEKAGAAGGPMYHNGERRDGYRGGGGYGRGGYNQHYKGQGYGRGGGGYRQEMYRGRGGYGGGGGYRDRGYNDRGWGDGGHHHRERWGGGGGGYRVGNEGHWRERPERIAPPPPERGYYTEGGRDAYENSRDGYDRDRDSYEDGKDLNDSREEGEIGLEEAGAYVRDANDTT